MGSPATLRLLGRGGAVRAAGRLLARLGVDHDLQDTVLYLDEYNGAVDPLERAQGSFPIHFASGPPAGELAAILRRTGGGVGTLASLLTPGYVEALHRQGLAVFAYSLDTLEAARAAMARCDVDLIFTNDPRLFARARSEG